MVSSHHSQFHHNYWKEGQVQPKMLVNIIDGSLYIKITLRIELRPPNPSCGIGVMMVEDSVISTTDNQDFCSILVIQHFPLILP